MKFKNQTKKNIKIRVGSLKSGYDWHTIQPGKIMILPQHTGEAYNLTKIENKQIPIPQKLKKNPAAYRKKLIDINGIGKKTADDIIELYPTEELLVQAIQEGKEIHVRDDIDAKIKSEFK